MAFRYLGHSSVTFTVGTCSHVLPRTQAMAAGCFDRIIMGDQVRIIHHMLCGLSNSVVLVMTACLAKYILIQHSNWLVIKVG